MAESQSVSDSPEAADLESSWVFIDRPATVDEVKALLTSVVVPYTNGQKRMDTYLPFVLPMTQNTKVKVPNPANPRQSVDEYHQQTTLYTQVAGRLMMLNHVAEERNWAVEIYPEPVTPTGVPGYLRMDDERIVFRVYVTIRENGADQPLGTRFGTSWVKAQGAFNAEASNPYETVETSALGRALAQWGFGVLPGSGIASVEEMRLARGNLQRGAGAGGDKKRRSEQEKEDRGDLIASAIIAADGLRKVRGMSQEDSDRAVDKWIADKFSKSGFLTAEGAYDWDLLTDSQIQFLRNAFRDALAKARADSEMEVG